MAKRKRRAVAEKKTASKRTKARARVKSARAKTAKSAGRKTKFAKTKAMKQKTEQAQPTEETVIVDIIEEAVPGGVVVTEIETVKTIKPAGERRGL